MSSTPTPYKPSPLSFNSPRQSPFRRPGSIRDAPSPATARPSTPTSSPLKPRETPGNASPVLLRQSTAGTLSQNPPSWLNTRGTAAPADRPASPARDRPASPARRPSFERNGSSSTQATARPLSTASLAALFDGGRARTPPLGATFEGRRGSTPPPGATFDGARASTPPLTGRANTPPLAGRVSTPPLTERLAMTSPGVESPTAERPVAEKPAQRLTTRPSMLRQTSSDALSRLPPPLLHSMRESFSVMDRDDDGHVNSADVADMLSQLGLSATPSTLATYFNGAQSINLATYLNTLSDLLGNLSRVNELNAAFEAFDDGDDGQIDMAELKDALLHTAPEPGEKKLTEREIDMVVDGFSGRRAFGKGGKGLGRGEVFRYQEFMASLTGGSGSENGAGVTSPT